MKFKRRKNKLNIVCIIPARGSSRGIPQKNMIDFCGKPLIVWSIEQARASQFIKEVYVSSDDRSILKVSKEAGVKTIERPQHLATDTSPSEDALLHAISHIQKSEKQKVDLVVFLQATSPTRTSEDIDNAISQFLSKKADSLFSAVTLGDSCIWSVNKDGLRSLTFDYKNRGRRQDRMPYYLENGSIYIFKPQILKKLKNRLGGKIEVFVMEEWKAFQIDTPADVEICEYFMKEKILHIDR